MNIFMDNKNCDSCYHLDMCYANTESEKWCKTDDYERYLNMDSGEVTENDEE